MRQVMVMFPKGLFPKEAREVMVLFPKEAREVMVPFPKKAGKVMVLVPKEAREVQDQSLEVTMIEARTVLKEPLMCLR
jgi:hypothetical protein